MGDPSRPPACRLAERWRTGESASLGSSVAGPLSVRARWAQRHTKRCARCRAETAEWARVERLLRRADTPGAPPQLYEKVMARIADSPRSRAGDGNKRVRRHTVGVGFDAVRWLVAARAAVAGCLAAIGVASVEAALTRYVFDAVSSAFALWTEYASSVVAFVRAASSDIWAAAAVMMSAVPPVAQPYVSALLWSGVGVAIAVGLVRGPRSLRL